MTDNLKTLTIEKVVQGGKGLARMDGQVVLVDRVLPGEDVQVSLRPRKGVLDGILQDVLLPSATRISADCPFYSRCGGCDFRHTDYQTELEIKTGILRETFQRIGKVEISLGDVTLISSPERNRYRIRTRFQCEQTQKGFFAKGSHDIVPVNDCLLVPNHLVSILQKTRCRNSFYLETHPFQDIGYRYRKAGELEPVEISFPGYTLLHTPGSFFQANRFLLQKFIETVLELAGEGSTAWELFAGSGFLTLPLAGHFSELSAMEWSHPAVNIMKESLSINSISSVSVMEGDCNRWEPVACDVLALDPPREGMAAELARRVNDSGIHRIVYISCDAATLARDINRLDNYQVEKTVLIDMFPGTAQFETMVRLSRK
ncbi:MAG: class I SAM-dependent RNA methyltransferase [Holophagae bacterium]|nr:class I SAM-dependent RNA methyltransferase [Holophagae bacterium]